MIPAALSSMLQQGVADFLRMTFCSPTRGTDEVIQRFPHTEHPTSAWKDVSDMKSDPSNQTPPTAGSPADRGRSCKGRRSTSAIERLTTTWRGTL